MAEPEVKKTHQENVAEVVNANASAGMTGQIKEQAKEIANKNIPKVPASVLPVPAGTKPETEDKEKKELEAALASYNKSGGSKGGGLFLLNNDPAELLKKKLADIEEGLTKGKKVRDLMVEMANPEVTGEEDAAIKKNIPQANRDALDFLLNNPAPQLDKPEISTRQELMELVGTSIMQAVASAVNGSTGTTGLVADPGAQIGAEGFNRQFQRISLTEDKIREIEQKQTAIDLKHKDDIVSAMQAYDADMDETARMYLAERNRIMANKVAISEKELDLVLNEQQKALALTGQITELTNTKEMFNLKQQQDHSQQQGTISREQARFVHDWRQNRQLMAAMSAKNLITQIGGEPMIRELQSSNLDGISVATINNDLSQSVSRAGTDPAYGQRWSLQSSVFSGDMKEQVRAQNEHLEAVVPGDNPDSSYIKKRVREDFHVLLKITGRAPGMLTTDALIRYPLTAMDGGRNFQIPNPVLEAHQKEQGDLGIQVLPTGETMLLSLGAANGSSTPELDADVFFHGAFTNQIVNEKWNSKLTKIRLEGKAK